MEWKNQWFFDIFTICILTVARLILDPFWHHLGGLDGLCWPLLAYLWPVLVLLWRPLAPLWRSLATGRASLGSPGCPNSPPWAHMDHLEVPLRGPWPPCLPPGVPIVPPGPLWTTQKCHVAFLQVPKLGNLAAEMRSCQTTLTKNTAEDLCFAMPVPHNHVH